MSAFPSRRDDEWWWCRDKNLCLIATSLSDTFVAIVDDFLPAEELHGVHNEVPNDDRGVNPLKLTKLCTSQ